MSRRRDAETELARMLLLAGPPLDGFVQQHPYVPGRRFAADFAWPEERLLVEVQGGIYTGGAHGSIEGIKRDIERSNFAALHGWRLLRFTPDQVLDQAELPDTLSLIETVLTGAAPEAESPTCANRQVRGSQDERTQPQRVRDALERALGGGA